MTNLDFIYDIETYPNFFSCIIDRADGGDRWVFEISDRRDDSEQFATFINWLSGIRARTVGFNNEGFDYPVIHHMMMNYTPAMGPVVAYHKAQEIINGDWDDRFQHVVWAKNRLVTQVDLFKIHHFDNIARSTSLKVLEFNMRSRSIEDLPFPPGTYLTDEQKDVVLSYNGHDVSETKKFYHLSKDMIDFRDELSLKHGRDFTNHNDTKIGKEYFIMELEKAGVQCFDNSGYGRSPRQTYRPQIALRDVIFPYVQFDHPEFKRVHDWLNQQTITQTKGVFDDVVATVDGFDFVFGTGGIHGSVAPQLVQSDDNHVVIDLDVTSYYPSLAIANRIFPQHLGETFCDIYGDLKSQRVNFAKGTAENAMLKLALNGVYGDSNNRYSPFYDPAYTMAITINGQLLLCMLAEKLMQHPDIEMIQINTDGLTVRVLKGAALGYLNECKVWWQALTRLDLEDASYSRMFIRDVNNYIAESIDGKLKRKGAYEYDREWHQNQSALVIPKAAEAHLVHGVDAEHFIRHHEDAFDFMLRTKVPRTSHLEWGDTRVQNVTRYYVAKNGHPLTKVMPALAKNIAKGNAAPRRFSVEKGWVVDVCNNVDDFNGTNINYDYYIKETMKLIDPIMRG